MIQKGTYLRVMDNSGAKKICCIHVIGGYRQRYAKVGDLILASIKKVKYKEGSKVKKGNITKALIVKSKLMNSMKPFVKNPVKYHENVAVLFSNQKKFMCTRILGGIRREFRYTRFSKILSLASGGID